MTVLMLVLSLVQPSFAGPTTPAPSVRVEQVDGGVRLVPDRSVPADARKAQNLLLEFGDTDLYDLSLFFADAMRLNLMLSDRKALEGKKIELIGHESLSLDAAWEAYLSALRAHGFTTSRAGDVVTIVPANSAARRAAPVGTGRPSVGGERIVTQLLQVEQGTASELVAVVKPLLSKEAEVMAFGPANTLIVTDTAGNVRKVADLVDALSVAAPSSTVRTTSLSFAKAEEVKTVFESLYGTDKATPKPKVRRGKKRRAVAATVEPAKHVEKVLAEPRTNTLIVLADEEGHAVIADLVTKLDVSEQAGTPSVHVVRPRYSLAEELSAVITTMAEDEKPAKVAVDEATNALAILATATQMDAIQLLIDQLDVPRRQVFVDAVFVELTSTGGKELSVSAHALPGGNNPVAISSQPDVTSSNSFSVTSDLLSGLAAGVFGSLVEVLGPTGQLVQVPAFGIALRALQTDGDVHVMGNPALLVMDHGEATLTVGNEVPVTNGQTVTQFGLTPNVERIDIGMELTVMPHINDANLVTMDVELSVDEVDVSASAGSEIGPVTNNRNVTTSVMMEGGQTIVIAGVASSKLEESESKVPLLGDIPILGALFRKRSKSERHTNLMVFLTPYIVDKPSDLVRIRRIKEAQRQEFVRRFQDKEGEEWLEGLERLLSDASDPTEAVVLGAPIAP